MKNQLFYSFLYLSFTLLLGACNNFEKDTTATSETTTNTHHPIEGTWELVWGQYGDQVQAPGKPLQIKQFNDKYFSLLSIDSTGKVAWGSQGTYELEGNIYKEKHIYNSFDQWLGANVEWNYEFKGDSLIITGPLKITDAVGNDLSKSNTMPLNSIREIRVRSK